MKMLALMVAIGAAAQTQAPPAPDDTKTVVVTAKSLESTERALAECLARNCPPAEDIAASLDHGENLFIAGDYAAARHVLGKSRGRNIRYSKELPVAIADLVRAHGRIAAFDGYSDVAQLAQIASLDALKAGLPANDAQVLAQRIMVGDEFVRRGDLSAADPIYRRVEKQAAAAKLPVVLGTVMLRQAVVYGALASKQPRYWQAARARIRRLEQTTDPALAPYREAVTLLRAQLAMLDGNDAEFSKIVRAMDTSHHTEPLLVYAPPVTLDYRPHNPSGVVLMKGEERPQWIDVGFEIGPDGTVKDIDVLRKTNTVQGDWPDRVRKALAARRYAPVGPAVDPTRLQRVERFSLVYNIAMSNRSRIMTRSPVGRIVSLDLTADPTPASGTPPPSSR